jgi:hypothetical protein
MAEQLALTEQREMRALEPIELIRQALSQGTSPEVVRELVALQQSMERFNWEREERQAKIDFDDALNACQKKIGTIAPNRDRENGIRWADYIGVDKVVRPVYLEAGFSIGFSEVDSPTEGRRMCATLSRSGVSRDYFSKLVAAGNSKMSPADAEASASSRAMRYLLLKIFNIAVGIDKDEKKPFEGLDIAVYAPLMEAIEGARTVSDVTAAYIKALKAAKTEGEKRAFEAAAIKRKGELGK